MHIQIEYTKDGCTYIVQPMFHQSFISPEDGEVWAKYLKKKIEGLINEDVPKSLEFLADLVVNEYMLKVPNYRCGIQMENDRFVSSANTRKNMEHFGSEAGVTDAMVYMTVIETLKMWGYNVKEYLERIFADAVKGITDYTQYDPAVMSLATR